jgi:hypothetical protein
VHDCHYSASHPSVFSVLLLGLGLLFFQFADMLSDLVFVTYIIRSSLGSVQVGLYLNH